MSVCRCDFCAVGTLLECWLKEADFEKALEQFVVARRELAISNILQATILFKSPLWVFPSAIKLNLLRCKCDFKYDKCAAGRNVFAAWHNIEVHDWLGTLHATFSPVIRFGGLNTRAVTWWRSLFYHCPRITCIWRFDSNWDKVLSGAMQSSSSPCQRF